MVGSIRSKPYHLRNLALRLFGIAVSQAGCEQNFSTLKWIIGDKRTVQGLMFKNLKVFQKFVLII